MANKRSKQKISELPSEMVDEIPARVSIKNLLRFRCVCRRWALLFKNKKFIAKHMTFVPRKFLAVPNKYHPARNVIYQQDRNCEPEMIQEEHDLTAGDKDLIGVEIIDHCNGLFCIQCKNLTLAVWNPSLRELRKLPISVRPYSSEHISLGYDDTIDDYKIIVLRLKFPSITTPKSEVEIFMLKSNPQVIDYPIDGISLVHSRTRLGKNIFWLLRVIYGHHREEDVILHFDIVSETFKKIPFPHFKYEPSYWVLRDLQVMRRRLCLVESLSHIADNKIVIWTTDQDKGIDHTKSWIKWFTVPIADIGISKKDISSATLLERCCDNDDKELLITINKICHRPYRLLSYNVEDNTFTNVETNFPVQSYVAIDADTFIVVWHQMQEYIETMVSPSS